MKSFTTSLLYILLLIFCYPIFTKAQTNPTDSLALVALYNSTNGPDWTNTWNLNQPVSTWYGVTVEDGRVTCLDLDGEHNCIHTYSIIGNNLSGNIPSEIGDLSELRYLFLNGNNLAGNLPTELGNLHNLIYLRLSSNQLSGHIPTELQYLTNLVYLELNSNNLSGEIPVELGNLSSLRAFYLNNNNLTGNIPVEFGNLLSLRYLRLANNQLTGNIPASIGSLVNLKELRIVNNQLSGCYAPNLMNLCNQLTKPLNNYISNGNNFTIDWESFCAGENCGLNDRQRDSLALVALYNATDGANWTDNWNLNEPIDTWHGVTLNNDERVEILSLSDNQLNGVIPPEIGNLEYLIKLDLGHNRKLRGNIPLEVGNLNNLTELDLSFSALRDSIPSEIGNLINLTKLTLYSNRLSGHIPSELGNLNNLKVLSLQYNVLSGHIPTELGNLTNLKVLNLLFNQLDGNIPAEIGNLSQLTHLQLNNNQLSGNIPSEIGSLNNLTYLLLHNNQLTGNIPNLENINYLFEVNLSNNKFSQDDILINYNAGIPNYYYSPQYHGKVQSHVVQLDTSLTLELSTPLSGNNNQNVSYQWKKNGAELMGSTDSTLTITNLQTSDAGKYTLLMTDPTRVADLEVISEPIYVIVPGYDLYGQPVEYQQLILEFDNWEAKTNFETDMDILDEAPYPIDSCGCNRLLYLWQFPNSEAGIQAFINTVRETSTADAEIDGGFNNVLNVENIYYEQGRTWSANYPDDYPDEVTVYILDSGTDIAHWDASPYLIDAPLDSCYNIPSSAGYDYTDTLNTITNDFSDAIGHGTFGTRSIAEGTEEFMNLNIVPLKVFDEEGRGTLFDLICGLYHAIDHDADIINISAGYSGQPSSILENAIALAHDKGQFIVTSAGNDSFDIDSIPQYPAYYAKEFYTENDSLVHYDHVISVTSIDANDQLSGFSNYGNHAVTLSAYGEDMGGYSHTGGNVKGSGSSISTYYVTRQLAVEIAKDKNRTYQQIWEDFEMSGLRECPATSGYTRTGKCLDIHLDELSLKQMNSEHQEIDTRNYPNPFTDHTIIEYTLPKDSPVTLTVYDAASNELITLHQNEMKTKGTHTIDFEANIYPAGMYYYTILSGDYFGTQKMILMK